jgi:hypothetical protein
MNQTILAKKRVIVFSAMAVVICLICGLGFTYAMKNSRAINSPSDLNNTSQSELSGDSNQELSIEKNLRHTDESSVKPNSKTYTNANEPNLPKSSDKNEFKSGPESIAPTDTPTTSVSTSPSPAPAYNPNVDLGPCSYTSDKPKCSGSGFQAINQPTNTENLTTTISN